MTVVRASASFKPTWSDFKVSSRQYSQQYSHVHSKRLAQLQSYAKARALASTSSSSSSSPPPEIVDRIIELPTGTRAMVCGTVVKNIVNRKEVVGDYAEDGLTDAQGLVVLDVSTTEAFKTMSSSLDDLVLEDDSGRVALVPSSEDTTDSIGSCLAVCW